MAAGIDANSWHGIATNIAPAHSILITCRSCSSYKFRRADEWEGSVACPELSSAIAAMSRVALSLAVVAIIAASALSAYAVQHSKYDQNILKMAKQLQQTDGYHIFGQRMQQYCMYTMIVVEIMLGVGINVVTEFASWAVLQEHDQLHYGKAVYRRIACYFLYKFAKAHAGV